MDILVISAGLSQPSSTRMLADRLADAATRHLGNHDQQATVTMVELRDLAVDVTTKMISQHTSPELEKVLDHVRHADALIVSSPIFNASMSGLFKMFFDLVDPDDLVGTPVLLGATGGTPRHSLALEHALRPMFSHLRALTVPTAVYAATDDWGADSTLGARIDRAGADLAAVLVRSPRPERVDPYEEVTPFSTLLGG
ncbi:FMN reductase [Propionibacteriaceae bacterium Y1685]|uniref:FMN reductase n=1 Tax=Microlunatus sp. Y1700 TaxID=3418487 RepID=UPI003B7CA751